MVSQKIVKEQLKRLGFKPHGWGRAEVSELPNVLLPDEEIYDLVNGIYEGGFALLVATNVRVILIDKKPLNYLTIEDLRFDMINELDYSHRLLGAQINIASGDRNLRFRSYNQQRLRKVITHVQHCMAEAKKQQNSHQEDQKVHLEQINQQLQAYLIAQHHQQEQIRQQLQAQAVALPPAVVEPVKPPSELADYLYAQSLLARYREQAGQPQAGSPFLSNLQPPPMEAQPTVPSIPSNPTPAASQLAELYAEGTQEIFGKRNQPAAAAGPAVSPSSANDNTQADSSGWSFEINPLKIARAKLPMALRNRKFGRPSFHAHSRRVPATPATQPPPTTA